MLEKLFSKKGKEEPKYYMCARRDNGFVPAYRAYFLLQGTTIKKISGLRYNHTVIFGKKADAWKLFSPTYVVFNIKAKNTDPTGWKIVQNEFDRERYDLNVLTGLLSKVPLWLKGYIQMVLHEFDGYQLIAMTRTDHETHGTILGKQSLLFRNGQPVPIGNRICLDDLREFYRNTGQMKK